MGNKVGLGLFFIFVNEVCVSMCQYEDYQKWKFNFNWEEKRQLLNYTAYIRDSIMGPESGYKDDDDPITRVGFNFEVSRLQEFDEVAGNLKLISSVLYSGAIFDCLGIPTVCPYTKRRQNCL